MVISFTWLVAQGWPLRSIGHPNILEYNMDPPFAGLLHQANGSRARLWPTYSTQPNTMVILFPWLVAQGWPLRSIGHQNIPEYNMDPPFAGLLHQANGSRARLLPTYSTQPNTMVISFPWLVAEWWPLRSIGHQNIIPEYNMDPPFAGLLHQANGSRARLLPHLDFGFWIFQNAIWIPIWILDFGYSRI